MAPGTNTSTAMSMRRSRAVIYAEDTLGINSIYDECIALEEDLAPFLERQAQLRSSIREVTDRIEEREMELVEKIRVDDPDMSMAKLDRELKRTMFDDEKYVQRKQQLRELKEELDNAEVEIRTRELSLRTRVTRMQELGAYMVYLGSVKNAVTAARGVADWPYGA